MFPDGSWTGFWSYNEDWLNMVESGHALTLTFGPETMRGEGTDVVGRFTMTGTVRGDRIEVSKRYVRMHTIGYHGRLGFRGCVVGWWREEEVPGGRFIWVPPGATGVNDLVAAYERTLRG